MSELLYAGKTEEQVAGYDDTFMKHVLLLPRDKYGKLRRRSELPPGVEVDEDGMRVVGRPVPYETMYRQTLHRQLRHSGRWDLRPEQVEAAVAERWERFLSHNPKFRTGGYEFEGGH